MLFNDKKQVHHDLGIDVQNLGCIMSKIDMPEIGFKKEWLYYSPTMPYAQGVPKPHVTLLYGLLPEVTAKHVDHVLEGMAPIEIEIDKVDYFEPVNEEPYRCIIAKLALTQSLIDAHARLSLLPHIDTFWDYKPHVTLAYVKEAYADEALAMAKKTDFVMALDGLEYGL